ncbi:Las1-like-domain-containing protein [Massariosphaeria phaeospora]|uniref:Las1-like-domain-containing protein n=1 Tax=Massariosphaeria phaeospora TaxID=100035 RepID=A0A7C8M8N8_9PLEO|nr:Las1-like-domain-containing protein [Massariosphaeria phaeospora]
MTVRFVVTPWRDSDELLQLRRDLYNPGVDAGDRRQCAVNKVFAWRVRKQELPLLLESTADLVDAVLQDERNVLPHNSLRLLYSTAVSRFITGISDTQTELARSRPVWFAPGTTLQFPQSLLETRHCIVHRHLPTLYELKRAAKESLDWLWEWYWSHLDIAFAADKQRGGGGAPHENAGQAISSKEVKDRVQSLLKTYVRERKSEIKTRQGKRDGSKAADAAVASFCFHNPAANQGVLAALLVDDKALLPADRKFGTSMSGAFLIWTPFLRAVTAALPPLLDIMVTRMLAIMNGSPRNSSTEDHPVREALYLWLLHILSSGEWREARKKTSQHGVVTELLGTLFTSPTYWNLRLARALLENEDLPDRAAWMPVLEAATSEDAMEVDGERGASATAVGEDTEVENMATALPASENTVTNGNSGRIEKLRGPQKVVGLWRPQPIGVWPKGWEDDS